MDYDLNQKIEVQIADLPQPQSPLQFATVEELKIQVKQSLLQITLEASEAMQEMDRWASVQRALLPKDLRSQPLRIFCRENADLCSNLVQSTPATFKGVHLSLDGI